MSAPRQRTIFAATLILVILGSCSGGSYLRRVLGEKEYCRIKVRRCIEERVHLTKDACMYRIYHRYGCKIKLPHHWMIHEDGV